MGAAQAPGPRIRRGSGDTLMLEPTASAGPHEVTWRQIEGLVDAVQALIETGVEEPRFYATLLEHAVRAGAAAGGAVWAADTDTFPTLCASGPSETPWSAGGESAHRHARFLQQVRASGQAQTAPPGAADAQGPVNASAFLLLACPVALEGRVIRIVEIAARPGSSPEAARTYLEVLATLCALAADFHRRARLKECQQRETQWSRFEQFCEQLQGRLDLRSVACAVANEARRLVGCDRVSVAAPRHGTLRVQAVSGLDAFDPRSAPIRQLEQLVQRAAVLGEPLFYGVAGQSAPAELETTIDHYVDQSHVRALVVLPLAETDQDGPVRTAPVGAVVLESFAAGPGQLADRTTLASLARQTRLALARAARYERIPAVRVWERLGRWRSASGWSRLALWSLPAAACLAALIFVPAEFRVTCRGQLKPQRESRIFAPRDGRVEQLHADHGETVAAGQVLATIQSSDLDFERTRLLGEIQTTTEQLEALRTSRLGAKPLTAQQRDEVARQTAEEERLKKLVASLQAQKQILDSESEALQVRSPIAGQVLTWNLAESLRQRPVRRGQQLMTVADTGGPWVLEIEVPDQDAGEVLDARRELGPDLPVTFLLATEPSRVYQGRVQRVAQICEPDDRQQLSVTAVVSVDAAAITQRRAGAGVVARIECGRRPLGYVWLHDLIQAVRAWLFV